MSRTALAKPVTDNTARREFAHGGSRTYADKLDVLIALRTSWSQTLGAPRWRRPGTKTIQRELAMATIAAPPVHHEIAVHEPAATEQAVYVSPYAKVLKTWTISLLVFGVALLGSISLWLWYGLQHYQDCL